MKSPSTNLTTPEFAFPIKYHVILASMAIAGLGFGLGGWAASAQIAGAVIAP